MRALMRRDVKKAGSMRAFAKEVGVTVAYVSDILSERRHVGKSIAAYYGYTIERRMVRPFTESKR